MPSTIEIIPAKSYRNTRTGQVVSRFSTLEPPYDEWKLVTSGWTWGITNHRGSYTEGLGRVPAKTFDEALEVANKLCDQTGAILQVNTRDMIES